MKVRLWFGRFASVNALRVTALCSAFAALIVAATFATGGAAALLRSAGISQPDGLPDGAAAGPRATRTDVDPANPTLRFSKTHVGQVLVPHVGGDTCERMLFDNRTGELYAGGTVPCGQKPRHAAAEPSSER